MPNWKKVIVSGSDAALNSLNVTSLLSVTGSSNLTGSLNISGSASIIGNAGTTILNTNADTLIFTGSIYISGSINQTGSLNITSVTSSLFGTASWAQNAITSSHAVNALSASYAITASYALNGGSGGGGVFSFHQTASAVTWSVNHNLNTFTPIVQVYDEAYNQLIPASISGSSNNSIQLTFSSPLAGYAILTTGGNISISGSNATLVQTTPATTWSFYHGLNETYPVFTIFDSNDDVIVPLKIHADNANTASIYFSTARTGTAVAANCGLSGSTFESASWAATASFAQTTATASYVLNAVSASYATNALSASYAQTASYANNFTVAGTLTAQTIVVQVITSSTELITGSLTVSSSLNALGGVTGSLLGTASWAENAITASYAATASSALNASDILIYVKNSTGTQINKGTVVRIIGAVGDNPLISTASYTDDNNSANTLGITNENIANDSFGYVMTEGKLLGINTDIYSVGQLLYLGLNGAITGSSPQAPLHSVRLGQVLRSQLNNGSMYVRINNGFELGELHDVLDTSTTSSYGDLFVKSGSVWINSNQLTGSYGLTGSLNATSITSSLFGTSSWAINAISSSYPIDVSGSTLYTVGTFNTNFSPNNSIYLGSYAGNNAPNSERSIFIGNSTGTNGTNASSSVIIGFSAGFNVSGFAQSVAIGEAAGNNATNARNSTFLGFYAGSQATNASQSVLIGYNVGRRNSGITSIGPNNIIIGSNITFEANKRDSINLGAIIFATGSYSVATGNPFSGSVGNGRVGINIIEPSYNLDVSGSGNFTNGLTVTGSLIATSFTGSLFGTASNAVSSSYSLSGSFAVTAISSSYPLLVTGSTIYSYNTTITAGPFGDTAFGSVIIGEKAGLSNGRASDSVFIGRDAGSGSNWEESVYIGLEAGARSAANNSVGIGDHAGYGINGGGVNSNVSLGSYAGYNATNAYYSQFIGTYAGYNASNAYYSNFIGSLAGESATNANFSVFVGADAGRNAISASYSVILGAWAGEAQTTASSVGSNNIIIGQGVTLPAGYSRGINIGGLIFGSGSSNTFSYFSGSANGRIGINQPNPQFSLDVSGSGRFTNGLTVTGSFQATSLTGSLQVTGNSTYSGSQTFTTGYIVLTQVSQSLNYVDDADAAANGVPLGGLYRNGNFIAIRIV